MEHSVEADLTPLAPKRRARSAHIRLIAGTASVILIVVWIAALADEFSTSVAPQVFAKTTTAAYENWFLFVGLGLAAGVAIWAFLVLGAEGATRVVVDAEGIRFTWPSGRTTSLPWNSPRFRLDLWVIPKAAETPDNLEVAARAKLRFHGPTDLTEEAFRAILDGADSHGLTVLKRRWHGVFPSDPVSTLMIRPRNP